METLADRIIGFNRSLIFPGELPDGISVMNPFADSPATLAASETFYRKYYSDNEPRALILGINPGRFGAGVTGIPFTDTKRLESICGIRHSLEETHEPSSVFVYEVIKAFGGPEAFYRRFYINSVSPLGFVRTGPSGRTVNFNYYDSRELLNVTIPFAVDSITRQLSMGIRDNVCVCLGTGKNVHHLSQLNKDHGFFDSIEPLEHPRFIMQYRASDLSRYVERYLETLKRLDPLP